MQNGISANKRNLMSGGDLFGEAVEGDALGTGDVSLIGVMLPRREDKQAAFGNGIKEGIGGFEELTEAVVGEEDDKTILL